MKNFNEYEFCECYVEIMCNLLVLKKEELDSIEETRNEMLSNAYLIQDANKRSEELQTINDACNSLLISALAELKDEKPQAYKMGFEKLYELLINYRTYALANNMKVPGTTNLTITDYYVNYLKALLKMDKIKALS